GWGSGGAGRAAAAPRRWSAEWTSPPRVGDRPEGAAEAVGSLWGWWLQCEDDHYSPAPGRRPTSAVGERDLRGRGGHRRPRGAGTDRDHRPAQPLWTGRVVPAQGPRGAGRDARADGRAGGRGGDRHPGARADHA